MNVVSLKTQRILNFPEDGWFLQYRLKIFYVEIQSLIKFFSLHLWTKLRFPVTEKNTHSISETEGHKTSSLVKKKKKQITWNFMLKE